MERDYGKRTSMGPKKIIFEAIFDLLFKLLTNYYSVFGRKQEKMLTSVAPKL